MGSNIKLRKPFIWEDEMLEVRKLFRRVDCIRKSGFTGFSTWESPPPSANTLSRNRLQRRRALCFVELSHLNYKEAPFESLNHLQNIRGMCTRIQRQDFPMERRKKDVDLISRPPLLRRSMTSATIERRGRKRSPFEVGRPYSAPTIPIPNINNNCTPNLGPIPLQYAAPKLTTLYDITQKSQSISRSSTCKSFNVQPTFDQCLSATSSKVFAANDCPIPCSTLTSAPNLPRTSKSMEDIETYGQILGLGSNSKMSNDKDCLSLRRSIKSFKKNINNTLESSTNGTQNCMFQTLNLESNERLNSSTYCGWSTADDTTTPSDIYSTSTFNGKSQTSNLSSSLHDTYATSSFKDIEREQPNSIRPASDYFSVLHETTKNSFQSKKNLKHSSQSSSRLPLSVIESIESKPSEMKRGYNSSHEMNTKGIATKDELIKNHTSCLNDIENFIEKQESNYSIAFGSISNFANSMSSENLEFVGQTNTLTTSKTRWLTTTPQKSPLKTLLHLEVKRIENDSFDIDNQDNEQLPSRDTSGVVVDDSNVLIKHSLNPYSDFRSSMVTMIEEEGLQNREAELEELFQYYLDLNPKVHHDVLYKVIQDIRQKYLLNMPS